jgi:transcriptional regulator with XRE-family HTH domain
VEKLRALRLERGWTVAELARRARVHPSAVSAIEHGRWKPWPAFARRVARVLGVRVDELLGEPERGAAEVAVK